MEFHKLQMGSTRQFKVNTNSVRWVMTRIRELVGNTNAVEEKEEVEIYRLALAIQKGEL